MWSASEALCQLGAPLPDPPLHSAPPAGSAPHSAAPLTPAAAAGTSFGWTGGEGAGGTVPASANQTPLATPGVSGGGCTPMR